VNAALPEATPIVFVVDDEPRVRESLDNFLRAVGLRVETFPSSRDFLRRPLPDAPACLVLDIRMPGQSGLDLQRELLGRERVIPIIFITGHGDIPIASAR